MASITDTLRAQGVAPEIVTALETEVAIPDATDDVIPNPIVPLSGTLGVTGDLAVTGDVAAVDANLTGDVSAVDANLTGVLNHDGATVGLYGVAPVAQAADIAALVDSIGGAVNVALDAIPDPADAPATADALRDDLVANTLPEIRDALSTLASQINAIRTLLRDLGPMA